MDLIKLFAKKIEEIEKDGSIDQMITEHVAAAIEDCIKDLFTWSGKGKKAIEEAIQNQLDISLKKLEIPRYEKVVLQLVEKHLNHHAYESMNKKIEDQVKNLTGKLEEREYRLSEIIEKYIESIDKSYGGSMEDQQMEVSLFIEQEKSFCHIYFDEEPRERKFLCRNKLFLHEGKVFHCKIGDQEASPFLIQAMNGFNGFLFKLYCQNMPIIVDKEDCELFYYREDYH